MRFASATREPIRILLTGAGTDDFTRAGTLGALFSISLNTPPGRPPITPPGTPPTTPLVVPTGGGRVSRVFCTGARMRVLLGVDIDGDGAVGARSFVALPAAAAGGWRYN